MSAPQPSPGAAPPANSAPKHIIRRRRAANPLVQKKKPLPQPTGKHPQAGQAAALNGAKPSNKIQQPQQPPEEEYEEIPIFATKRALTGGLRHHVLRFLPNISSGVQQVNLLDESQFQRPVRLHRRDPRANNWNHMSEQADNPSAEKQVDDKERERLEAIRADKRAEREALAAQTAPVVKKDPQPKRNRFGRKFDQSRTFSDAQEKKKNATIKYEEALPWHIEDFEDKNIWRGTYETALSDAHVALVRNGPAYLMVPLEKWYKFTPKNKFQALSFEEAEKAMNKGAKDPLLLRKAQHFEQKSRLEQMGMESRRAMFSRKGERGEQPNARKIKGEDDEDDKPEAAADIDDIDFNYDEDFADDEEGPELVGADEQEQAKETDDKVKREMREAPVFELREEKDFDAEAEEQKRKEAQERKHRKRVERALMRREKNYQYEEDSDDNPFASDGDSEDSEIERQKEEEAKQEEEKKKAADGNGQTGKPTDKPASGASTKGTSTPLPSGKPAKSMDPLKKLKRPGSPSMSEASGNESSVARKKQKRPVHGASNLADGTMLSRPGSPSSVTSSGVAAPQPQRPTKNRMIEGGAGSGSEVELSDGSRIRSGKKRGPPTASPDGSRPGSPGVGAKKKPRFDGPLPSNLGEVIASAVPAEGITIQKIIGHKDIAPYTQHPDFMNLMKRLVRLADGLVFPKTAQAMEGATPAKDGA